MPLGMRQAVNRAVCWYCFCLTLPAGPVSRRFILTVTVCRKVPAEKSNGIWNVVALLQRSTIHKFNLGSICVVKSLLRLLMAVGLLVNFRLLCI